MERRRARAMGVVCGLLAVVGLAAPEPAHGAGPGMHVRESGVVFDTVVQQEPWKGIAATPYAKSYLQFGALSPDFDSASVALTFGHQRELSYYLLEQAVGEKPEFLFFALGHLCHMGSDAAMHAMSVASFFSSDAVGLFGLYGEYTDGRGDSEGIVETIGDLVKGDWMDMVDVLYDFWFEDDVAKARAADVFQWYCEKGSELFGANTDCAAAQLDLEAKLNKAEPLLGFMDRAQAKDLVQMLIDQPMEDIIGLASSGQFAGMLSGELEPSPEFDSEVAALKKSPLMDKTFYDAYDAVKGLGPAFTLEMLETQAPTPAWPVYDGNQVICGNVQSVMNFLPDEHAVVPGLTVDAVSWTDADGSPAESAAVADAGKPMQVQVTFFSSRPYSGTVTGVVKSDMPGFDTSADAVVGEASVSVDIVPTDYMHTQRSTLTVPFVADIGDAVGFYLEMYQQGGTPVELSSGDGPWFTTSWDRLWSIDAIDFARPIYRDNFATYGHWPPSLPVSDPTSAPAWLMASIRIAPAGAGIPGAALYVTSGGTGHEYAANEQGLAVVDDLEAGTVELTAAAAGYATPVPPPVQQLEAQTMSWVTLWLDAVPDPHPAGDYDFDSACMPFAWDVARFGGQAETFSVKALSPDAAVVLAGPFDVKTAKIEKEGSVKVCFDPALSVGDSFVVSVRASYTDGSLGVVGLSPEVTVEEPAQPEAPEDVWVESEPDVSADPAEETGSDATAADLPPAEVAGDQGASDDLLPGDGVLPDTADHVSAEDAAGTDGSSGGSSDGGCSAAAARGGTATATELILGALLAILWAVGRRGRGYAALLVR